MPRFERKAYPDSDHVAFFEVEQRGATVLIATGGAFKPTRQREKSCANEEEAYIAFAEEVRRKRRGGYVHAGPARELPGVATRAPSSALLLDVYFAAEDERFLEEVLHFDGAAKLAALAQPWFEDRRPFARRTLLAYIDDGCDRPGHKALVKRLFKLAERAADDAVMARFMVAFDRWSRRHVAAVGYDWDPVERKVEPRLGLLRDPMVSERLRENETQPRFTRATRGYLARRAFRYFRRLGYGDRSRYRKGVALALERYEDHQLSSVGRLLSAWGLMHVLYGRSPVLARVPAGVRVAPGRSLNELVPAPIFADAWRGALEDVMHLLEHAASRTVRTWALALLRAEYSTELAASTMPVVKALILSRHEEPQLLGVELLGKLRGLESVSIDEWLELLGTENLELLAAVCDRAQGYVSAKRLSLAQCVDIASSKAAPLAALGLEWCKEKKIATEPDLRELLRLGKAPVQGVRADAARYCAKLLGELPFVRAEHARELVDAPFADARAAGLQCATKRFPEELELWLALSESPYPDVRAVVVERAKIFRRRTGADAVATVFGAVMLSLQGAAGAKRRVCRELTARLAEKPDEAETLLPMLTAVLRSIHPAERRMGLAALATTAMRVPSIRGVVEARFPEIAIGTQVSE